MPSSYSTSIRVTLQATGEGTNTWGSIGNTGGWSLVDDAVAGVTTISASGATALSTANGATDQARKAVINYTGATAGVLTIPSVSKVYQVRSATAAVTLTNGSNSLALVAGDLATVATDGTSIWKVQSADFATRKITGVGAPTASTDVATKAYADGLAFNAVNLPGQNAGTINFFVKSDGTAASWAAAVVSIDGTAPDATGNVPTDPTLLWFFG